MLFEGKPLLARFEPVGAGCGGAVGLFRARAAVPRTRVTVCISAKITYLVPETQTAVT